MRYACSDAHTALARLGARWSGAPPDRRGILAALESTARAFAAMTAEPRPLRLSRDAEATLPAGTMLWRKRLWRAAEAFVAEAVPVLGSSLRIARFVAPTPSRPENAAPSPRRNCR